MTGPRTVTITLRPAFAARVDLAAERTGLSTERFITDLLEDALSQAIPSKSERPALSRETAGSVR